MQVSAVKCRSPSFGSSGNLSQIAARVIEEFRDDFDDDGDVLAQFYNEFCFFVEDDDYDDVRVLKLDEDKEEDGFQFEFASVSTDSAPISADEIFHNGMIRPIYPVFETLIHSRPDLRKLFVQERETPTSSCSSSEADELDGVAANSYCVWRPKAAAADGGRRKKRSSVDSSSKRWKLKSLLQRSHSLGSSAEKPSSWSLSGSWINILAFSHPGRADDQAEAAVTAAKHRKSIPPPYKRNDGEKQRSYLP